MKNNRIRNIIIIGVFVLIAFYIVPLFMQAAKSPMVDKLDNTLLPWEFIFGAPDGEESTGKSVRIWTKKLLKLGLDLQGGMQLDLQVMLDELPRNEHEDAVKAAEEIIRNRIDQFGVAEPSVTRQGKDRIVVQLPGLKNFDRAKDLIGKTALLEFKIAASGDQFKVAVDKLDDYLVENIDKYAYLQDFAENVTETPLDILESEDAADSTVTDSAMTKKIFTGLISPKGKFPFVAQKNVENFKKLMKDPMVKSLIPAGVQFLLGKDNPKDPFADRPVYIVYEKAEITGKYLTDARVEIGQGNNPQTAGKPYVTLVFNKEGQKKFGTVTGQNIGERLAIILDDAVYIAPRVEDKIRGNAIITGLNSLEEAQDIAIVLKAGNLPAPIEIINERTVGPTLGKDSIKAGFMAAMIGLALVFVFMAIYYGVSGLVAVLAVIINMGFVLAMLTMLEARLTMPGIAGMILTIGMAVDANVLIFERIREELRAGKTVRSAVDSGFNRALVTILDANITTLITAVVLYQFGTGPLKGFAVTLSIGIIGSMFASIVLVKAIFDTFITNKKRDKLSI